MTYIDYTYFLKQCRATDFIRRGIYFFEDNDDTEYDITCNTIPPQVLVQMSQRQFDIHLKVGSRVFPCHRDILIANSEYFRCMLSGNFKETNENIINLPTEYVDEGSFSKLLHAIYGEPLKINDDILPLLATCSYLQLTYLANECEGYTIKNLKKIDWIKLILLPQLSLEYSSLYFSTMKCICQHFGELYPRMVGISFELLEELLKCEDLLIFNPDYTLEFCKLWLHHSKHREKMYQKNIANLTMPFRDYRKDYIVERCEQYIKRNFIAKERVELFQSLYKRRAKHPLYKKMRHYICEHFRYYLFNLDYNAKYVTLFCLDWLRYDIIEDRKKYQKEVEGLMKPFIVHLGRRRIRPLSLSVRKVPSPDVYPFK